MARLQILELPEGSGDDRPPFLLVIDQVDAATADDIARWPHDISKRTGARHVLCFSETVDIPANEVPLDADGNPLFLKMRIEGDFEQFREQAEQEIQQAQSKLAAALNGDQAPHATEVEQLRAGEEPYTDEGTAPTPAQWIWKWNRATPEKRLSMAAQILDGMPRANDCLMLDHEARVAGLSAEVERLRTERATDTASRDITVDNAAEVVASHDPSRRA